MGLQVRAFKNCNRWTPAYKDLFIGKTFSVMQFLACTQGTQGNGETFRWPCEPIILSIGHFESPTKVQLNSW